MDVPATPEPIDLATIVAAAAHELRSPLASLRGFARLLADRWHQLDDDERNELLTQIDRDAERMARLVDELVDLSRLDSGRLTLLREPVTLAALIDAVVRRVCLTHPDLSVRVVVEPDVPLVHTDRDRVAQILTNLLENAAKYATGARAEVRALRHPDTVEVRVDDEGPGLSAGERVSVFAPYARRPGAQPSGLGLGLWIARRLAGVLGGTLVAEPNEHGGTSFRLTLPAG